MAVSGASGGAYLSPAGNRIPSSVGLDALYTRHVFARGSAVPTVTSAQAVASHRGGFNSNFSQDGLIWHHPALAFVGSNSHRSGGSVGAKMTTANITADTWHSMGATWDGTNVRSYLNGVLDGTSSASSVPSPGNTEVALLASSSYGGVEALFAIGAAAELALWNVVLTAEELSSLAKGFRATLVRPANLIFYAPVVRSRVDVKGGRTLGLAAGSEVFTDHPRVFG